MKQDPYGKELSTGKDRRILFSLRIAVIYAQLHRGSIHVEMKPPEKVRPALSASRPQVRAPHIPSQRFFLDCA